MAYDAVLFDTSFVIALENKDDPRHEAAKQLDRELSRHGCRYVLHWGIVLEIADGYARVGRRGKAFQLLERIETEFGYDVQAITDSLWQDALTLYRSRADKDWSLTDCVSFSIMHQQGLTAAMTADRHFEQAGFTALLLQP